MVESCLPGLSQSRTRAATLFNFLDASCDRHHRVQPRVEEGRRPGVATGPRPAPTE